MANCLGLYIEDNLIKYAKVTKEKDKLKIDSFGIKFYDNMNQAIKQIVEETFSFGVPISINLSKELYNYFDIFSLLNKNDLKKAIGTEFDFYCIEKGYNANQFESRYAIVDNIEDKEKLKAIHVSINKIEFTKILQKMEGYKLTNISPMPMSIPSILNAPKNQAVLVVNIEENTTVTTIVDEKIYDVTSIEEGSKEILEKINLKENSYSKAYEICKNTTIYTADIEGATEENTKYLEDIMPTLYNIVGRIQKIINQAPKKIEKIYITGTMSCVNNIDLYFEEYLGAVDCEILKPYFIQELSNSVNMKDYIEVNSAIALAMQGLNEGIPGMNFKKATLKDKLPEVKRKEGKTTKKLNLNINTGALGGFFENDFSAQLTRMEINLLRTVGSLLIFIIIFASLSINLVKQIENKKDETRKVVSTAQEQINLINEDVKTINSKTSEYTTLITNIQEINERIADINRSRNNIPNLLNSIMQVIPREVQITSIKNTVDKRIVITAQTKQYETIGYFKAKLINAGILLNVVSDSGVQTDGIVKVTIEGDLPWEEY